MTSELPWQNSTPALDMAATQALAGVCFFLLLLALCISHSPFRISHSFGKVTDPLSITVSQTVFDGTGLVTQQKNGLNKTTQLFYDSVGRLSYSLDPLNRRIDNTFDDAGRQLTLKNRNNQTFTYGIGTDGLPTTFTYPSGRQSSIVDRDLAGRPHTLQKPGGQQTVLTYEGMGRIKTQADGVGTITWTYDGEGNPTNVAEGSANISRTFDDLGRVLSCTDTAGNTVSYTYENEGNLATITYPGNKTVTYTYDGSNRLKTVTDWAGRLTTYTWDLGGRLTQVDRPNGTRQRLQYDNANRLSATYEEKGATSIWQAGYGFDNAYRLTSYNPTPPTRTYAPPPATMTYDTDNRLVSYNSQTVTSDTNGNLLSAPVSGSLLGALTWDTRNRLLTAGGTSYVYDAENRRVSSTKDSQTTTYTWSRGAALDRLLVKNNPDGSVTRYIYGLGLIYEETTPSGGGSATTQFYHYNWQGSTMALSDAAGNVTARLSYSPYGEVPIVSGTPNTPFLFNGQFGVMTEPNGLFCMQARYYSPIFRRFLSEDPIGFAGGINLFAYTSGDPVNFIDPMGWNAYFAFNPTHVWLAVTTPKGNVARQDFYAVGWTGGSGNSMKDAVDYVNTPGIAPITVGKTIDEVMGKESWTVYEIPMTSEQDLATFRTMVEKMLHPPAYSDFRNNCGDEAVDTLSSGGWRPQFPSGIFPNQFGESAGKIFGPPIRQQKK